MHSCPLQSDVDMHALTALLPCRICTTETDVTRSQEVTLFWYDFMQGMVVIHQQPAAYARLLSSALLLPRHSLFSYCKRFVVHLQAVSSRNKQPRLSVVKSLLKRLKPGCLRGSFVANDCTINPVVFSKGQYMTVQSLPVMTANNARRHQ